MVVFGIFALASGGVGYSLGYSLGRRPTLRFLNIGEAAVSRTLKASFQGKDYHLMNNITLPYLDGTTQVDHILVSLYGVFVIETKHWSGWIFGDSTSKQ